MNPEPERLSLRAHFGRRLLSGLFVLVPLWITVLVVKMLFNAMASVVTPFVHLVAQDLPNWVVFLIAIVAFLLLVYLAGVISAYVFGRRLLAVGELLIRQIPIVRNIYGASKQIIDAISLSNRAAFKSVVLVEFPRPGMYALGFLTGTIEASNGRTLCKLFIPTSPNPTSGFMQLVPKDTVRTTSFSVEEGVKMIVSGGVLSPERIETAPMP